MLIPGWGSLSFQSGGSVVQLAAQEFHDYVMIILVSIVCVVGGMVVEYLLNTVFFGGFVDYSSLEVWWTVLPGVVLLFIAYPSLSLLYFMDEIEGYALSTSVVGHQWYWEYALPGGDLVESYLTNEGTRLLDVDNRLIIPANTSMRLLVTAADVLHSWAVPTLGVKIDAVPGRLNQICINTMLVGLSYGQCSEVCGVNHSFMPIVVESLPSVKWVEWVNN